MKRFPTLRTFTCLLSLAVLPAAFIISRSASAQNTDGIEELTRGPVHEAFAESVAYNPEPGLIISKPAPELIEELPPEQRPVGDNIAWIPGYWSWDEEREDFIWISGVWRNVPPGRQWVPGYWADTEDKQYQWISGYWAAEDQQETAYLPPPPKSVENGPNIDAPSDNHIWVSGNWAYRSDRYVWSPGYWEPARENWVWVPAHYDWTPRGYVFVDGYWDYDVDRRGMVFAPVHFDRVVYSRPDYVYSPVTVIALEVFSHHLFVRPRYRHYYFGDYYEPRYRDSGFFASFHYHRDRRGYDPFYAHNRWRHRGDRDWDRRRNDDFEYFRDHRDARPPRTLAALLERRDDNRRDRRDNFELARRLDRVIADRDSGRRFEQVNRREFAERTRELRDFGRERSRLENRPDDRREGRERNTVSRERFNRSPLAVKLDQLRGNDAPPPRRETRRDDDRPDNNRGSEADRNRDQRPGNAPDRPMRPGSDDRDNRDEASRQQGRENGRDTRPETATRPGQNERDNPGERGRGENRDGRETPQRPMTPDTTGRENRERPEAPAQRGRGEERGERRETPAAPEQRRETPQRPQQREETPARPQTPPRQIQEQRQQEQRQQEQRRQAQQQEQNRQAQQQQAQRRQAEERQQEQRKQAQQQQQRRQEAPEQRRQEARPQRPAAPERREARPQENRREARPQQAPQRQQKAESRGGENRGGGGERGGGRERKKD